MKILFSILINSLILLFLAFLLSPNATWTLGAWVVLWCMNCSLFSLDAWKTYLIWGVILWLINVTVKPILKVISLPFFLLFFGLTIFVVNAAVLWLFSYIMNDILIIPGISYTIIGWVNFVIAVAIFTILNTLYSLLFFKH